jgi:hypothetical protein
MGNRRHSATMFVGDHTHRIETDFGALKVISTPPRLPVPNEPVSRLAIANGNRHYCEPR